MSQDDIAKRSFPWATERGEAVLSLALSEGMERQDSLLHEALAERGDEAAVRTRGAAEALMSCGDPGLRRSRSWHALAVSLFFAALPVAPVALFASLAIAIGPGDMVSLIGLPGTAAVVVGHGMALAVIAAAAIVVTPGAYRYFLDDVYAVRHGFMPHLPRMILSNPGRLWIAGRRWGVYMASGTLHADFVPYCDIREAVCSGHGGERRISLRTNGFTWELPGPHAADADAFLAYVREAVARAAPELG